MNRLLRNFRQMQSIGGMGRSQLLALVPGILLIALAVAAIVAPEVIAVLVAAFLLYVGFISLFVGWKIIQFRRKVQQMMQDLSQRVQVVSFNSSPFDSSQFDREQFGEVVLDQEGVVEVEPGDISRAEDGAEQRQSHPEIRKIIVH